LKPWKYVNALILLITIGLVVGPVLRAGIRSEVAHWYLAAAANEIELGKGQVDSLIKAEKAIASARAWDPDIGKLPDYLSVRLRQLRSSEAGLSLAEIFADVPDDRRPQVAEQLARHYFVNGDYGLAADVMQELLGEEANRQGIYWNAKIYRDLMEVGEAKAIQTLQAAIASNPEDSEMRNLAEDLAHILELRDDFAATLAAYKLSLGDKFVRSANNLNSLAYARALAKVELDQALIDIDEALSYHPNESALRDTRAWIYYQLGRYEEALVDADFSVTAKESPSILNWWEKSMERFLASSKLPKPEAELEASGEGVSQSEAESGEVAELVTGEIESPIVMLDPPKNYLTRSGANNVLWSLGVMRYHRAMILDKLGRSQDAEADWKWVEENRLPPDDRLH
jgi:tetratricopeptide (TPR) repeat protein